MIAAIDGSQTGDIKTTKWAVKGDQFGFSSPVIDGTRVYQIDNGSRLKAFDVETGRELWQQPLGTVQKAPLVLADGKLYVGTENGKFFIVRPSADKAEILSGGAAPAEHRHPRQTAFASSAPPHPRHSAAGANLVGDALRDVVTDLLNPGLVNARVHADAKIVVARTRIEIQEAAPVINNAVGDGERGKPLLNVKAC